VVQQDVLLFRSFDPENLRYGRPDATDEKVYCAADAARCSEFISRLPDRFETIVGAAQAVRWSAPKAGYCAPFSATLDYFARRSHVGSRYRIEQLIQDALTRLFKGRT
jgi:ATP-binding cassette subfamily B protein